MANAPRNEQAQNEGDLELAKRSIAGGAGQVALVLFYAGFTDFRSTHPWLFGCLAGVILVGNLLRVVLGLRRNIRMALFGPAVVGPAVAWGILFFVAITTKGLTSFTTSVSFLVGSGTAAAMITSLAPHRRLALAFITIVIGLPIVALLLIPSAESIGLAIIFAIYHAFLSAQLNIHYRAFWEGVANRQDLLMQANRLRAVVDELEEQKQRTELNAKLALLGELGANLAHEIRNPLAVIVGSAEVIGAELSAKNVDLQNIRKSTERILQTGARISKIINGLMRFIKRTEDDPYVVTELGDILRDSLDLVEQTFRRGEVRLLSGPVDFVIPVRCRPTEISQVLVNLLTNAFEAAKEQEDRWVRLSVTRVGGEVHLAVTDSGKGIPKEVADQMFTSFFTTKGTGTGLGLTLSRQIMEHHDGGLDYDPTAANTTFVVRLPIAGRS